MAARDVLTAAGAESTRAAEPVIDERCSSESVKKSERPPENRSVKNVASDFSTAASSSTAGAEVTPAVEPVDEG